MLLLQYTPTIFRESRTILLPKKGDLSLPSNWRPITISSLVIRVFHRILAGRLGAIEINGCQQGFVKSDGAMNNTRLLHQIIRTSRKSLRSHVLVGLDLKKAFDTVAHSAIWRALEMHGVDQMMVDYLKNSYSVSTTRVMCGISSTEPIRFLRGVKQGDPLSPCLFNLVLDEVINNLENSKYGMIINGRRIATLAYADDLVLVAPSINAAQGLLNKCGRSFGHLGLEVNAKKCFSLAALRLKGHRRLFLATTDSLAIGGNLIPAMGPEGSFSYLGRTYTYLGCCPASIRNLPNQLANISKSPLKPQQKLSILRQYLIPRYIYELQNPTIHRRLLRGADRLIRSSLKKFLHLPVSTPNGVLYSDIKSGGLGIFNFNDKIPDIMVSRCERLRLGGSDHYRHLMGDRCDLEEKLVKWLMRTGRGSNAIRGKWKEGLELSASGGGITHAAEDSSSTSWVNYPPPYWNGADYVRALQLRYNVLPTQGGVHNCKLPFQVKKCRAGCQRVESLSHVLQGCPVTHAPRIQRHDWMVNFIKQRASKRGWQVEMEPHLRDTGGRLRKPDLVLTKNSDTVVLDVGVSWEGPRSLGDTHTRKIDQYGDSSFAEAMAIRHPGSRLYIRPVIVGARGIWCARNNGVWDQLGLTNGDKRAAVCGIIKGSIQTHSHFRACVWATNGP